jgi:hypothetical protein
VFNLFIFREKWMIKKLGISILNEHDLATYFENKLRQLDHKEDWNHFSKKALSFFFARNWQKIDSLRQEDGLYIPPTTTTTPLLPYFWGKDILWNPLKQNWILTVKEGKKKTGNTKHGKCCHTNVYQVLNWLLRVWKKFFLFW